MNSSHTDRTGFTLVELLVVIAIIGLLVGLLLPAVQAAREAARGMQCKNNLHQIALGVEMFHDTRKSYPPARYQPRPGDSPAFSCGGKETTWLVRIMPYIEAGNLEQEWDYAIPYADHPEKTRVTTLPTYCCPSRRGAGDAVGAGLIVGGGTQWIRIPCGCWIPIGSTDTSLSGAVGDYGGNHGDLSPGNSGLPTDFVYGDHVFNTGRLGGPTMPIARNLRGETDDLVRWGSWHTGVCNFAFADGSVRSVSSSIDTDTLGMLSNRKDGKADDYGE